MDEMSNKVVLNDEDGNEVEFELLDLVEYSGEEYVVMLPCDETADDGMVVILKLEQTDDEDLESYVAVEDEQTLNAVFEIFKEMFKEEFTFED